MNVMFAVNKKWTRQEDIQDVQVYTATGLMFTYEVQITPDQVTLTAWVDTPATRWEPGDVECVAEETFPTFVQAIAWADRHDRLAAAWERKYEDELAAEWNARKG
jgi:hypothetical protein